MVAQLRQFALSTVARAVLMVKGWVILVHCLVFPGLDIAPRLMFLPVSRSVTAELGQVVVRPARVVQAGGELAGGEAISVAFHLLIQVRHRGR